jgi:hypothetical protein
MFLVFPTAQCVQNCWVDPSLFKSYTKQLAADKHSVVVKVEQATNVAGTGHTSVVVDPSLRVKSVSRHVVDE